MGHLREISDDAVAIDILPYCDRELGLVVRECSILEDFFDPDGVSFFIGYLDTDESEPWDRCLDTDRFCLEREREVVFEIFDFCQMYSVRGMESVLCDSRSDTLIDHLYIDIELEECALYAE